MQRRGGEQREEVQAVQGQARLREVGSQEPLPARVQHLRAPAGEVLQAPQGREARVLLHRVSSFDRGTAAAAAAACVMCTRLNRGIDFFLQKSNG